MELCAFVELDLKACLDFSCVYRFHSTLAVLLDNFGSVLCISAALTIASRSFGINGNGFPSSLVGSDS